MPKRINISISYESFVKFIIDIEKNNARVKISLELKSVQSNNEDYNNLSKGHFS